MLPGSRGKFGRLDDSAEDAAAPYQMLSRPCFHLENKKAALVANEPSLGANRSARSHGFKVVNFDARANCDCTRRQVRLHSLSRSHFHHADHRRSRKHSGEPRIIVLNRPLMRDSHLYASFEAEARMLGRRNGSRR